MGDRLEELRHELDELRRDLDVDAVPAEALPARLHTLIVAAVDALEALEVDAGAEVRRRWALVDVA